MLLYLSQAARMCGVAPRTMRTWCELKLPRTVARKLVGRWRIDGPGLRAWRASETEGKRAKAA